MHAKDDAVYAQLDKVHEGLADKPAKVLVHDLAHTELAAVDVEQQAEILLRCERRHLARCGAGELLELHQLAPAERVGVEIIRDDA